MSLSRPLLITRLLVCKLLHSIAVSMETVMSMWQNDMLDQSQDFWPSHQHGEVSAGFILHCLKDSRASMWKRRKEKSRGRWRAQSQDMENKNRNRTGDLPAVYQGRPWFCCLLKKLNSSLLFLQSAFTGKTESQKNLEWTKLLTSVAGHVNMCERLNVINSLLMLKQWDVFIDSFIV